MTKSRKRGAKSEEAKAGAPAPVPRVEVDQTEEEVEGRRFRYLMMAEKVIIFSSLDTERLRKELRRVVISQDLAIDSLCDELALFSIGTQDPTKPASYFLVGPTGVGKNHLVESMIKLFENLWRIEIPYLELEGPGFTYPSDINELKGSARGFIRSDEEGLMTQFHRRSFDKPISVILIDEVEKSHPQLRNFFLPIMDRGVMMDNRGSVLHFENTIIFFTSNLGFSDARQKSDPIGFGNGEPGDEVDLARARGDVRRALSPEFMNRVNMVYFKHLSRESVDQIFDLELGKIQRRYRDAQNIRIRVTDAARAELLRRGYNRNYGARNLAKVLNRWVNVEVSKVLKQDQGSERADVRLAIADLRQMRDGMSRYDRREIEELVRDCSRIRVPYNTITVDFQGGELVYLRDKGQQVMEEGH